MGNDTHKSRIENERKMKRDGMNANDMNSEFGALVAELTCKTTYGLLNRYIYI